MPRFDSTVHPCTTRVVPAILAAACALPAFAQDTEAGTIDHTPPVLRKVDVTGSVNAQVVNQYVTVTIKATDDLSGVISYLVDFRSPSGQHHIQRLKTAPIPRPSLTAELTLGAAPYSEPPFLKFAEPGTWVLYSLTATDANNNTATYDEAQLRSIPGNHTFFVSNNGGYDITPPQLANGVIDTPNVRLSKQPIGTPAGTPPYVAADLSITDAGNGVISGSREGKLVFCLSTGCTEDGTFTMDGLTNRVGLTANTLTVGTQLSRTQIAGNYLIYSLQLVDSAGSSRVLYSTDFGGGTNFHTYFPQGVAVFLNQ
jgi:hypothetical protein